MEVEVAYFTTSDIAIGAPRKPDFGLRGGDSSAARIVPFRNR